MNTDQRRGSPVGSKAAWLRAQGVTLALGCLCLAASLRGEVLPDGRIDFGVEGLPIPPVPNVNATSARTLQLLVEAAGRTRTLSESVRYVREIASCQLPGSIEAMKAMLKDSRAEIRAEAAAGLAILGRSKFADLKLQQRIADDGALVATLQAMTADADERVRVAALDALAAVPGGKGAMERALAKPADEAIFRRAVSLVNSPEYARGIAGVWGQLNEPAKLLAAEALGRCGDGTHGTLVSPLLKGSLPQKVAALHALAGMKAVSYQGEVEALLKDPSSTVRREALLALASLADAQGQRAAAVRMMQDADPTVRQAAVTVLGGVITPAVLEPIAAQLGAEYKPLYDAATRTLSTQKDAAVRQAAIELAAKLLEHVNPRRRQDGSYILGAYRSDAALEKHIAIVESSQGEKPDWVLIGQAIDSLGRIGRPEAKSSIVKLSHQAKNAITTSENDYRVAVSRALIASARLGDASALPDCIVPASGSAMTTPSDLRAAGIFGVGMLGTPANAGMLPGVIRGELDSLDAKVEAVKAIGNLRSKGHLSALKRDQMLSTEMLWLAHWASGRITGDAAAFVPEPVLWRADVSISDITPQR